MSSRALAWPVVVRPARRTKLLISFGKATPCGARPRMRGWRATVGLSGEVGWVRFVSFTGQDCRDDSRVAPAQRVHDGGRNPFGARYQTGRATIIASAAAASSGWLKW